MSELQTSLRASWERLASDFAVEPAVAAASIAEIVRAYSSPGRYYHNLQHVRQVLDVIEAGRGQADNLPALLWAAWFHDVVYDPRASANEERSADEAERVLHAMKIPEGPIAVTRRLILDTKTHQPSDEGDSRLFLDADLAILGAPEDPYNNYARAIRQEYAWVPEPAYRAGRQQVLRNFLQRPRIYFTATLFATREERARSNLTRELQTLSQPLPS